MSNTARHQQIRKENPKKEMEEVLFREQGLQ